MVKNVRHFASSVLKARKYIGNLLKLYRFDANLIRNFQHIFMPQLGNGQNWVMTTYTFPISNCVKFIYFTIRKSSITEIIELSPNSASNMW